MDFVKDFEIKKEEGSQVVITGEIPFAELEKERATALARLGKDISVDGFRKGHVPENIVLERVGEMQLLNDMAERALSKVYPAALKEHEVDAIGYPQIQITKIAMDNPLGFTATVAVVPPVALPDFKTISTEQNKDAETVEVTDEELDTQVKTIQRQKLAYDRLQTKAAANADKETGSKDMGDVTELPTPESEAEKATETHTHADGTVHEGPDHSEPDAIKDEELPELTDEYVKTLGQPGQFEDVEGFKQKLREHLTIEKEREVTAKRRAKITDAIEAVTEIDLPKVLIDSELQQLWGQLEGDLKQAGMNVEEYLEHIKKSREDMITEWTPAATKRAKLQLILNEIAKQEKITPDENEVKQQVNSLLNHYKDADEARVKVYVTSMLTNEAVLKMLEEQK